MERVQVIDADLFTGFCTVQAPGGIEMPDVKYLGRPPRVGQLGWREEVDSGVYVFWGEGAASSNETLIPFCEAAPSAGASNTLVFYAGRGSEVLMPRDGSITSRSLRMALARVAGTLTVEFTVNGTQVSALDAGISASNTLQVNDNYALGTHTFSRGDRIACRYDSSGGYSPVGIGQAINVALGVILE